MWTHSGPSCLLSRCCQLFLICSRFVSPSLVPPPHSGLPRTWTPPPGLCCCLGCLSAPSVSSQHLSLPLCVSCLSPSVSHSHSRSQSLSLPSPTLLLGAHLSAFVSPSVSRVSAFLSPSLSPSPAAKPPNLSLNAPTHPQPLPCPAGLLEKKCLSCPRPAPAPGPSIT